MNMQWKEILLAVTVAVMAGCSDSKQPQTPAPSNAPSSPAAESQAPAVAPADTPQTTAPAATATTRSKPAPQPAGTPEPSASQKAAPAKTSSSSTASGQLLKKSDLKDKPFIDASTVAALPAQSKVTIMDRNGGWYRVSSSGKSGWLRMLDVKVTGGAENLGGSNLGEVASLATGRAGSGNVVSTSGLRGLNEEKLSNAKPDYGQLDKLDGYGESKQDALDYAKKNGLQGRQLAYLPAVKR